MGKIIHGGQNYCYILYVIYWKCLCWFCMTSSPLEKGFFLVFFVSSASTWGSNKRKKINWENLMFSTALFFFPTRSLCSTDSLSHYSDLVKFIQMTQFGLTGFTPRSSRRLNWSKVLVRFFDTPKFSVALQKICSELLFSNHPSSSVLKPPVISPFVVSST